MILLRPKVHNASLCNVLLFIRLFKVNVVMPAPVKTLDTHKCPDVSIIGCVT